MKRGFVLVLPSYVKKAIDILEKNGFEAYAVGGCVRDMLLGREPNDYDITTSALPVQIKNSFEGFKCIETGIKHGTVSVIIDENILEITTYRIDGKYLDNRHPSSVLFTSKLKEDLKRRDFTINAMAYSEKSGLKDFFGGREDLENKTIRCVGDAQKRFEEDALRILRALRFSAVFGFEIEDETKRAVIKKRKLLYNISHERIRDELVKIILSDGAEKIIEEYSSVIEVFIPELAKTHGLLQHNKSHIYDVFTHTVKSVGYASEDINVRLCMLLHDIGKPYCFSKDEEGKGHFYGHQKISANIAEEVLKRLRFDNKTTETVSALVSYHDGQISADEKSVKRWLRRLGERNFLLLLEVKKADSLAHSESYAKERIGEIEKIKTVFESVVKNKLCYNLKMLEFTGRDAMETGFEGKAVGEVLDYLLTAVIENRCENEKNALCALAGKYKEKYEKKISGKI